MTRVVVHSDVTCLPPAGADVVPVLLYGSRPPEPGTSSIGARVWDAVSRLKAPVNSRAFDFLSLAMAVTAADTFVDRHAAADVWARTIELTVALAEPQIWYPLVGTLEQALRFLSGDEWTIQLEDGGESPPPPRPRARKLIIDGCDCACLYSGGLDSAIGMLNLHSQGRSPILVSHAYVHDARRQHELLERLRLPSARFGTIAHPVSELDTPNDVQMRTRSFNFLAMGALVASSLSLLNENEATVPLYVPENGLIAINPPLTNRRIGALSTRTTHPHYLKLIQSLFDGAGLPVRLENPFAHRTKGEMITECLDQARLGTIADRTVSCGKWKRTGIQCGRCVPCLIRRASFHGAGWQDRTEYAPSGDDLRQVFAEGSERDDLMAMILAARKLDTIDVASWIAKTGPMPAQREERAALVDVVERGMAEVKAFLDFNRLLQ